MFLYKNGRFHIKGISFAIPDGFYFVPDEESGYGEAFCLLSPDQRLRVTIRVIEEKLDPVAELEKLITPQTGYRALSLVSPTNANGLKGYSLYYGGSQMQSYEAFYPLPEEGTLDVIVDVKNDDIFKVVESDHFKAVLSGLRLD